MSVTKDLCIKIDWTPERALELARAAVKEKGEDFVYTDEFGNTGAGADCVYVTPDLKPSCFVGHMLVADGVEPALLTDLGGIGDREFAVSDPVTLKVLKEMQDRQDEGNSWGEALGEGELIAEYDL